LYLQIFCTRLQHAVKNTEGTRSQNFKLKHWQATWKSWHRAGLLAYVQVKTGANWPQQKNYWHCKTHNF